MRYFSVKELQKFAQQTADAICSVLNMQVTIVDEEIRNVAGTGCFFMDINKNLPRNYVFARVISTGKTCFIENPGQTEYCFDCSEKNTCKEKATLLVPVKLENKVIGGIGLAAMTEREKIKLIHNVDNFTRFMEKMADLLSAKISSSIKSNEILLLANNLNTIIDAYPYGVMSIDFSGNVTHFNRQAEYILNIPTKEILGKQYRDKICCSLLENALATASNFQTVHSSFSVNSQSIELILSIQPIFESFRLVQVVCFFQLYKEESKFNNSIQDTVKYSFNSVYGQSPEIKAVLTLVEKFAPSNSTVLITGESGTGKELFAKAIHYASNRSNQPFVAINCSAIPDNLLESELFGYAKGAFTSANTSGKIGKFELANKGTILLDEIGDMPLNLQAKLLRVLQEKKIERLGDVKSIDVDIRILAATNKNLQEMIEQKLFREDLYYRINVIPLHLPPLRDRQSDIPILAKYFLEKYNSLMLKNINGFHPETMSILNSYNWPGNIRQLENVIEYAVNMENTEFIEPSSLPMSILNAKKRVIPTLYEDLYSNDNSQYKDMMSGDTVDLKSSVEEIERMKINELVSIYGNSTDAKKLIAQKLNISISTLYRKLKKAYG